MLSVAAGLETVSPDRLWKLSFGSASAVELADDVQTSEQPWSPGWRVGGMWKAFLVAADLGKWCLSL